MYIPPGEVIHCADEWLAINKLKLFIEIQDVSKINI